MNINYAELYGVKPGETDFYGAIHRTLEKGPSHLGEDFIKALKKIRNKKIKTKNNDTDF